MYTIIGGDGREYGPVTADQVRAWIAAGRADADTKVKAEGSAEWRRIGDTPELSSGAAGAAGPQPPLSLLPSRTRPLDVFGCFERSWNLLKGNFWPLVGTSFVVNGLLLGLVMGQSVALYLTPLATLFGGILSGGIQYYFLKKVRGQPTHFGEAFAGFTQSFFPLLAAGILIALFTFVGFLCLVLPGVYLMIAYSFSYILVVDRKLGFWEAMEHSRKVVTRQWWRLFGVFLLCIPFILLGFAAFGIGVFIAIPLCTGALIYAYEDLFTRDPAPSA